MILEFKINTEIEITDLWAQAGNLYTIDISLTNQRAYILVCAVAIEDKLYTILKSLLPSIKFLDEDNNLSFSFKINLLKSFEFCHPNVINYLHLLRKIRNQYAHNMSVLNLETLPKELLSNIDQIIIELNPEIKSKDYLIKIETIIKWLFWQLHSLNPYSIKLREIMDSSETKKLLNQKKE